MAILIDAEDSSALVNRPQSGTIPVPTVDLFAAIGNEPVSLLKMDIEGGERTLLADPRFATLDVHMLLLEWHDPSGSGQDKAWCRERLTALGFAVSLGRQDGQNTGLFTAVRARPAAAGHVEERPATLTPPGSP
jgi:methyltransferase FkbM-like protein